MSLNGKILVVDDEASIRFAMEEALSHDGHQVVVAESGETALQKIDQHSFDLALIDLRLPGLGGMGVLAELRKRSPETVVIVLTAHASVETAVEALRHGAHDYLFKPCKTAELRESIQRGLQIRQKEKQQRNILHQLEQHLASSLQNLRATIVQDPPPAQPEPNETGEAEAAPTDDRFLRYGSLTVDFVRHIIALDESFLELSPTEFNLLTYLINEAPRVIPPQELVRKVQGYESEQWEASETVRYHIYRIRQKIKAVSKTADPNLIRTVRGVGYTISED
ncbi:MAG: response regulator transcription factor [Anaerolineae bacterium]|nr:response regulator transcription factor [Anaerolineae bacterium]